MKWLRLLCCLYVLFEYLVPDHGLVQSMGYARAASIAPFNAQQLQIPATGVDFNALIAAINCISAGQCPATGNNIFVLPASNGQVPTVVSGGPGSDPNTPIGINPSGNGDIILFYGQPPTDTGALQFANAYSWLPAKGLAACPAMNGVAGVWGAETVNPVITGYIIIEDWLGNSHGLPAC